MVLLGCTSVVWIGPGVGVVAQDSDIFLLGSTKSNRTTYTWRLTKPIVLLDNALHR